MGKNESHFHKADDVEAVKTPWPGVTDKILAYDPETQDVTKLEIYAPGWKQPPGSYTHNYREEIYVISGKMYDHHLDRWVYAGEYACRPPGQKHGPFECAEDEGCTVMLINTYGVKN